MSNDRAINVTNSAITTIPGTTATVILFDSTANPGTGVTLFTRVSMPQIRRVTFRVFTDGICTAFCDVLGRQSSTWRTVNGGGAGEATAANTEFERDFDVDNADDFRIRVTTPGGALTVWDCGVKLSTDRALAM